MYKTKFIVLLAMLTLAVSAFAEEEVAGFTLTPGIGIIDFDSTRRFDNEAFWSLGGGYRFDNPWAVELNYASADSKSKATGLDADVEYLSADALYHLPSDTRFKPFLLLGFGKVSAESGGSNLDESIVDLGAGFKYLFSANSALRTDLRLYQETSGADNLDIGLSVAYQYSFGKASQPVDGDDDNDGVPNSKDQCPDTPSGAKVDATGCTIDGDEDQDGVADSRDRCPGTPVGVSVDANGCPDDSDGDGVKNGLDKCPGTPAGVSVGADGCPNDDDRDGVINSRDKCPGTPAGVEVDVNGCGPDADMDGVPDHRDECPQTFPPALIDELGCYVMLEEVVRITLDVEFDFDSAASRPEHAAEVKKVADFMAKFPLTNVVLEGHTDSKGSDVYNQSLSERRAATIGRMLTEQFDVNAARVSTVGYGESRPIDSNDTKAGRQRNRRVVAEITAMQEVKQRLQSN